MKEICPSKEGHPPSRVNYGTLIWEQSWPNNTRACADCLASSPGRSGDGAGKWRRACNSVSSLEWPLCMITSDEQISPPSLVLNCKVAKFCIKECPKAVNLKRISTQKECKRKEFSLQTRLGGEICSSDVIMHKGHLIRDTRGVVRLWRLQCKSKKAEQKYLRWVKKWC